MHKNLTISIIPLVALFFSLVTSCVNNDAPFHKIKFNVIVYNPVENQKVFITGNNPELADWNPSKIQLDRVSDSLFSKTLKFKRGTSLVFKITAGSWWLEALDSNENLFNNFTLDLNKDTTVTIIVYGWKNTFIDEKVVFNEKRFRPNREYFVLDDLWKYHSGDNHEWSAENFDDSNWQIVNSYINWDDSSHAKWNNIGWFRFHFIADTSLWNKSLALLTNQLGASQIYYNGKLLYSNGVIGNSKAEFNPSQVRIWKTLKIEPKFNQVLAVRYANYNWKEQKKMGFAPGFTIYFKDINTIFQQISENTRGTSYHQMVFTLIPLILFFLHIFIFIFNPKQKENLFYAICLLGFAGITYFGIEKMIAISPKLIILDFQLNGLSVPVAIFFGIMTFFSLEYQKIPLRAIFYFLLFIILSLLNFFYPLSNLSTFNYIYFGIIVVEVLISNFIKKGKKNPKGGWIVVFGLVVLIFFVTIQILLDYAIIQSLTENNQVFGYGMVGFALSMSLFLSYNFSQTNKNLESQLKKVKELSEKTIEQERLASKLEMERRIMENENNRKTLELENAKKLQLSLLPKDIPKPDNFDIAFYMSTASEVGGDYYDILSDDSNQIMIAIGDATGHGVSAGIIVSIVKGLIHQFRTDFNPSEILRKINEVLISMKISNVYMGLTLLKINNFHINLSSGGMPPALLYKKNGNQIQDIIIKRMPLGATNRLDFEEQSLIMNHGDILLLFSDGISELFNADREMFDYNGIKRVFYDNIEKSSPELISELKNAANIWRGGADQLDDMTLVVVKCLNKII